MTRRDYIFGAVCAIIGAIVTLALCVLTYTPTPVSESVREVVKTDTVTTVVTLRDTVEVERLKPIYTEVIRRDTIPADTVLLVERLVYDTEVHNDSLSGSIRAVVSGTNPSLDSLTYRFNIPTRTITQTIETERIIKQKTHLNYGIGVMAGYSIFAKKPDIMAGVFIGYSF